MKNKIRVAILTATNLKTSRGSVNTVFNLLENLNPEKYTVDLVFLDGLIPQKLRIPFDKLKNDPTFIPAEKIKNHERVSDIYALEDLTIKDIGKMFDVAIVAIYNEFGEDGKTIGLLEVAGVPYLSPGLSSSALSFDKEFTKSVLRNKKIQTPANVEVNVLMTDDVILKSVEKELSYPVIVKPTSNGASRGTSLVKDEAYLLEAVKNAFNFSKDALVEEYINGQEFTVGIIGHYSDSVALPPVMIKPKNDFFDYEAKYVKGMTDELCPAPITKELEADLQMTAVKSYKAVKADNHARVDMIYKDGQIYVLEVNSFPGLIEGSLFPKELKAAGITLGEFLDNSIKNKLKLSGRV